MSNQANTATQPKKTGDELSTSKLALVLGVEAKVLFALLTEKAWLRREGDRWVLTNKGKYQGGTYRHSEKYGDYVVWPRAIIEHPTFDRLKDGQYYSATRLAGDSGLSGRQMNQLLQAVNWLKKTQHGWQPTALGKSVGAKQKSTEKGLYVLWPGNVRHHPVFVQALSLLRNKEFDSGVSSSLDGHSLDNSDYSIIDNGLYLAGIVHSVKPLLTTSDKGKNLYSDFYLPVQQVYIEYWGEQENAAALLDKLDKKSFYQKHGLNLLELEKHHLLDIEKTLVEGLLQFGFIVKFGE